MAGIEAHEFSARPFSSVYCNECEFGVKHPIHTIGHISGSKNTVTTNVGTSKFITKDSGSRTEYTSGMKRDVQSGKPRFDLLLPVGVPHSDQFLTRVAELLARGAEKYDERNWEKASGEAELSGFKASAIRHLMQWLAGETDEDHAAAVVFNLLGAETVKWKMRNEPS